MSVLLSWHEKVQSIFPASVASRCISYSYVAASMPLGARIASAYIDITCYILHVLTLNNSLWKSQAQAVSSG
jgi:hypothetical protein